MSTADGIASLTTSVCALSFVKFIILIVGADGHTEILCTSDKLIGALRRTEGHPGLYTAFLIVWDGSVYGVFPFFSSKEHPFL